MLSETDPTLDVAKIIAMLLIHDIVEIAAGDAPIHGTYDAAALAWAEQAAAERIFGLLPPTQRDRFLSLWHEFEAAETADARFAKALDRLQPAHSADPDQPFQPIVITDSGDPDHAVHYAR
jgi:putative hydrolase of HD superfamily